MNRCGYHLLGIGGAGMSALAHLLLDLNYPVSGLDAKKSTALLALEQRGALPIIGAHAPIPRGKSVVYSTAIPKDHLSWQEAQTKKLPLIHRSELLAQLLSLKKCPLLIAGTHGKTSVTALLTHTLAHAGLNPSFALGGESPSLGRNGKWGSGDIFVAEADESDGSFLRYYGSGAILTNIDDDHLDYWQTKEKLLSGFHTFSAQIQNPSYLFWCRDDPLLTALGLKGVSYGVHKKANLRLEHLSCQEEGLTFTLKASQGKAPSRFTLPLIGEHQAVNALAVIGMARALGLSDAKIQAAFQTFDGVKQRLKRKGEVAGITFYDDYAHHPTAIAKVIGSLKKLIGKRRLVVVFEPHRFSRTKALEKELLVSFGLADLLIITDIFAALEKPLEGISAKRLCSLFEQECYYASREELTTFLPPLLRKKDVVITLGAGSITDLGSKLLRTLS